MVVSIIFVLHMKKNILLFVLLSCCQGAFAYDFSVVAPSGQTLYCDIVYNPHSIAITSPTINNGWGNFVKPIGNLVIPDSVIVPYSGTKLPVTSIGNNAFINCNGLTSVTIPNTVNSIGNSAFYGCTGLTSVTIPNSVTSIGTQAFYGCTGLTSVTIPNSVTSTGDGIFYNCTGLTSATILSSTIGNSAFRGCISLTSVNISDSVTTIGSNAFQGCTGLTSVTIPESVTYIYRYAFINCTGLTSVVFNAVNCTTSATSSSAYAPFCTCPISSFTFGNNVKVIPDYICWNLTGLTSVTIPDSVTSIGIRAFCQCTGLTSVVFNADSCTYAGYYYYSDQNVTTWAFRGDTNITNFTFGNNVKNIPKALCAELTGLTTVVIPNSVTSIGKGAFSNCSGLASVTIGNSVVSIDTSAFYQCSGLASVAIPNSVASIGPSAFYQCTGLTSVTIPDSVTSIGRNAFSGCSGLISVTIGNSVTSIGINAFEDCSGLTSVIFNADSCTSAGTSSNNRAFLSCANISSFTIGSNVRVIPAYLCYFMYGLTSVTLPNSVTYIGDRAFQNCRIR